MKTPPARDAAAIVGFSIGVGLCTVALVGTVLQLMLAGTNPWLIGLVTFLIGGLIGGAWAAARGVDV